MVGVQLAAPQITAVLQYWSHGRRRRDTGATAAGVVGTSPQRHSGEEGEAHHHDGVSLRREPIAADHMTRPC
jgi:hypothetical protein